LYTKAVFDYKIMFKSIRTHLLCQKDLVKNNDAETEAIIFDLIRRGRTFISNYRRGDARGFRFWVEDGERTLQMGESGIMQKPVIRAVIPREAHCRLMRDGEVYQKGLASELQVAVPPGSYRLEVMIGKRGWIYSNHIKILE